MPNPIDRKSGTVRTVVEDEESIPIDMPPMEELIKRTRRATEEAKAAKVSVGEMRTELHEYAKRDVEEHAEIRGVMSKFDDRQHQMNGHISDLRVGMASVGTKLDTFVSVVQSELAEKTKNRDAAVVEGQSKRDHKRHLLVAVVGIIAAIIGALVHWAFR